MIVKLTSDMLESFSDKAENFHKALGLLGSFNAKCFMAQWEKLMATNCGHVFALMIDGVPSESIGMVVYEDLFTGDKTASMLFWFVNKRTMMGAKLYLEVEAWARESGIKRMSMASHVGENFVRMNCFLDKMGYSPCDIQHVKQL